jgi:hypothetical protein
MDGKPLSSENLVEETKKTDNRIDNIYNRIYHLYPQENRRGYPISPKESPIVITYKFGNYYLKFCIDAKGNIRKHKRLDNFKTYYLEFIRVTPSEDMTKDYYWYLYTQDKETGDYTEYANARGTLEKQVYTKGEWEYLEGNTYINTGVSTENWPSHPKSQISEEDIIFINQILDRLKEEIME